MLMDGAGRPQTFEASLHKSALITTWGVSSAGRASDCLSECQGFDPPTSRQDSCIVAQSVEQRPCKQLVVSSNLTCGTTVLDVWQSGQMRGTVNPLPKRSGGSNPSTSTNQHTGV